VNNEHPNALARSLRRIIDQPPIEQRPSTAPPKVEWKEDPTTGDLAPFVGDLAVGWAPMPGSQEAYLSCPVFEVLYHGTRGPGKRIANSTPVLTNRGWVAAGDVVMADKLVALDGSYTRIVDIFPCANRELFRVVFHDGAEILADAEHRWLVLNGKTGYREGWKVRTTEQIRKASVPYSVPFMQGPLPGKKWDGVDPYMVGLLLGDGTMRSKQVTLYSADDQILEYAASLGWLRYKYEGQCGRATCPSSSCEQWRRLLPRHMSGDKRVPRALMEADPSTRLLVLQGLMDSDGSAETCGKQRFVSKSEKLARDVAALVWSLGGVATVYKEDRFSPKGGVHWRWRVTLRHNNKFNPFRLSRKANRMVEQKKFLTRGIKSIEPAGVGDGVCFAVAHKSHCFVIDKFVVTHNSTAGLIDFGQHVGKGFGTHWQGIVFRRTYPELEDIIDQAKRWFPRVWPNSGYHATKHQWEWATGEKLMFRHADRESDYWSYHGRNIGFFLWEELTTWPNLNLYKAMMSICRSPIAAIPKKYRSTTNPYGIGHGAVRNHFKLGSLDPATKRAKDEAEKAKTRVDSRKLPTVGPIYTDDNGQQRVAIRGHIYENKILLHSDPGYIARLTNSAPNPAALMAWLEGDWDVVAGGMFDDVWVPSVHVVPDIPGPQIPKGWNVSRAYDHGQSKPFSVGWWACSDGTPAVVEVPVLTPEGIEMRKRTVGEVRGDVVRLTEWYGCREGEHNVGLNMTAVEIGAGIREREDRHFTRHGIKVHQGPADNSVFDANSSGTGTVARDMARPPARVTWSRSDKGPGSRIQGWQQIRKMLKAALSKPAEMGDGVPPILVDVRGNPLASRDPALFICQNNEAWIRTVPTLPRDKKDTDDVDTNSEDHCLAYGTVVNTPQGSRTIGFLAEHVPNGTIYSADGKEHTYHNARRTRRDAPTVRVFFANGKTLRCTPDHRVMLEDGIWCEAQYLHGLTCYSVNTWPTSSQSSAPQSRSMAGNATTFAGGTSREKVKDDCTSKSGLTGTARMFRRITRFTTKTMTGAIINQTTWSASMRRNMASITGPSRVNAGNSTFPPHRWQRPDGTEVVSVENGTGNTTAESRTSCISAPNAPAGVAASPFRGSSFPSGAATHARVRRDALQEWIGSNVLAPIAGMFFGSIGTAERQPVPGSVVADWRAVRIEEAGPLDVYCLSVPSTGNFAVNGGLIVKNCGDETRYHLRRRKAEIRNEEF
jgi:hypothetical protein